MHQRLGERFVAALVIGLLGVAIAAGRLHLGAATVIALRNFELEDER
jgi:hypothetical protein